MNGTMNTGAGAGMAGMDQVFLDGVMQTEARWPNINVHPATIDRSNYNTSSTGTILVRPADYETGTARYGDSKLAAFSANALSGAYVHFIPGAFWWPATGKVIASTSSSIDFTFIFKSTVYYEPRAGDLYYLWGKYELLDAPGEWFRKTDDSLFVYTPNGDSPNNHLMEVKRRSNVIILDGKSNITIIGIQFMGGGIRTTTTTANLTLDNIDATYMAHYTMISGWWHTRSLGVVLSGPNTVIKNSHIAYTIEDGIKLRGENSKAINNVIHDVGYLGMSGTLLGCEGPNMEMRNNTVWGSGGAGAIDFRHSTNCKVSYNDAFETGKGTFDGGILFAARQFDAINADISYNIIHDGRGINDYSKQFYGTSGIYLEGGTTGYNLHHNIIYDVAAGISMPAAGPEGDYGAIKIYNNTMYNKRIRLVNSVGSAGVEVKNNFMGGFEYSISNLNKSVIKNNITTLQDYTGNLDATNKYTTTPKLTNPIAGDFMPLVGSPLIDAGMAIPSYTDGYKGTAPDIGAFETTVVPFVAGALLRLEDVGTVTVTYDAQAFPAKKFTLSNLAVGRKLPLDTKLKIGTSTSGGVMQYDHTTKQYSFTQVPNGNQTGVQKISIDFGVDSVVATASTIDLGGTTDTQAPTAPIGLVSTSKASNSITLSWTASTDNVGVTGYDIYNGTTKVNTSNVTSTTFIATGLNASTAYNFTVKAGDAAGNVSASSSVLTVTTSPAPVTCSATGTIFREYWSNISGTSVLDIPTTKIPTRTSQLPIFETATDTADNYGNRIRGYICPPFTGDYIFWIASDDNSELYLGTNNLASSKVKIASVTGWTASRDWIKYPSQQSTSINLQAGTKYYIEVLHKENTSGDNLAVGWQLPDGTMERPILGSRLSPYIPTTNEYDTQSPSTPTLSLADKTSITVSLSWTVSTDNFGVKGYDVYNGITKLNTALMNTTTYTMTNVAGRMQYDFTVRAVDGAGNQSTSSNVFTYSTGVTSQSQVVLLESTLSVYPNPSNGIFTLNINNEEKGLYQLTIYNAIGEKISTIPIEKASSSYHTNVSIAENPAGLYYIEIHNPSLKVVKKIFKQ